MNRRYRSRPWPASLTRRTRVAFVFCVHGAPRGASDGPILRRHDHRVMESCYGERSPRCMQIGFLDISRACCNAKIDAGVPTYVQLLVVDKDAGFMCGELLRHMYGTRAAADGWQDECSSDFKVNMGSCRAAPARACFVTPPVRSSCQCTMTISHTPEARQALIGSRRQSRRCTG